jgi:HAD superfamily hydrolase (TIGR01509 family)
MSFLDPVLIDYKDKSHVDLLKYVKEKKTKMVYFDLGDTLVYIPESIKLQISDDLAACGINISVAGYDWLIKKEWKRRETWAAQRHIKSVKSGLSEIRYWVEFFAKALNRLGVQEKAPQIIARLASIQADPKSFELYPYALEILKTLKEMGIEVGIISNAFPSARKILEQTGLIELFDEKHLILSCEYNSIKPEAGIYKEAITRAGVEPNEIVFIDDRESFLGQAVKQKMNALVIRHETQVSISRQENKEAINSGPLSLTNSVFIKIITYIRTIFPQAAFLFIEGD